MKYPTDAKCLAALSEWDESARSQASEDASSAVADAVVSAPEMTPIEQIVFFTLKEIEGAQGWRVTSQKQIGKYRVDFLLDGFHAHNPLRMVQVIIECDGHDYHERTKEQAQRDKERDRTLQSLGFLVFRFTGSEIWRSGGKCVLSSLGVI